MARRSVVLVTIGRGVPSFTGRESCCGRVGVKLGWFPPVGQRPGVSDQLHHVVPYRPSLCASLQALVARVTRSRMLD